MKVIFFDGVCGLCNGFVDFIMKIDKSRQFQFSPLQSEFAQQNLPPEWTQDLKSVVLKTDGEILVKTDAVIKVLTTIGGIWSLAVIGKWIPLFIRNWLYDSVALNRYRLFGKKDTCRLPTPDERARFLN